jgi:hypothetical protein
MKILHTFSLGFTVALAGTAYAQEPSTNDTSDAYWNTGMGTGTLGSLTPSECSGSPLFGCANTAAGYQALLSNSIGSYNTAVGFLALEFNTTSSYNTAVGSLALFANQTGGNNTASGVQALTSNLTGNDNTASGGGALALNTAGINNTATGYRALYNTNGNQNIAVGWEAGLLVTGSNNIEIGNQGFATDNDVIRIGSIGAQKEVFIAGVHTSKITGSAVYVTDDGRLGVLASSERYKTAIAPMGADTAKLRQLRPVTFKLKGDAKGTRQYGLIAEEVATVYPELVIRDQNGRIDGVRYDELAPMLLNEMQQQKKSLAAQAKEIGDLKQREKKFASESEVSELKQQLQAALAALQAKDQLVAQR